MRKINIIIILLFISTFSFAQKTEHVIIAVVDGVRYTESFGDTNHQHIPNIWNLMKPNATIYTSFFNNGTTSTCPGHSSILTGTWQHIANDGSERPHSPTCFEYYRKHSESSNEENYVVLGKSKLNALSYSDHADYGATYAASVKTSTLQYSDTQSIANLKEVITKHHPKLIIANFPEVDSKGHSGVFSDYTKAIHQIDSIIYNLWNFIQADSIYANKTTLIITNDHGRHTTDFSSHGDNCEGCRHIMLMIIGPDTPKGMIDEKPYEQIDILPTIANILKFPVPLSTGKIIQSATDSLAVIYDTTHVTVYDTTFSTITDTIHITKFDTTIVLVYDTVFTNIFDTTNIIIYDTIYHTHHDTITTTINDTTRILVNDTIITNITDTNYLMVYDTTFINIFDSTITNVYDTLLILIYDTVKIAVSDTLIIDIEFTNTNTSPVKNDINVYPNPTNDLLIIQIHENSLSPLMDYKIQITNLDGKRIFNAQIQDLLYEINLRDWGDTGTYLLQIIDSNNRIACTKTIILK